MRVLSILLSAVLAAAAQQPESAVRFRVATNLVIVNVAVKDRSGQPILNLKPEDFVVLEDGKPQKVSVFEFQQFEDEQLMEQGPVTPAAQPAERRPAITPSAPGQVRYKDRRLLVLFFDFSSMPVADQIRAQQSSLKFLDEQMSPADMVAIMAFSNRLQVLQDFTSDRETLKEIIRGFRIGEASELAEETPTGDEEVDEDTGAAFTADETEFNIFNTDRKLSALETAAKMLSSLPEKKALVYFSSGVGKTGAENQSQLRSTINAAVRGNVSFYPVDARGLVASAPGGDATKGSPRGSGIYSGQSQRQQRMRFNDQQETLFTLAEDTGGKALLDSNDLSEGIRQAKRDISSYYILGYYSTNPAEDGRFRRIQVRLASHPGAKLDYRSGYFAAKKFRDFTAADKERQLEEALLLGDPITDLTLALEVNYFRMAHDRYFVPVAVKIPGSELELARRGGSETTRLDFIAQVRDSKGKVAASLRDNIQVRLRGEKAGQLSRRHLQYDSGFSLAPGDYVIKFLARENETGKIGTFETKFSVPDLDAEQSYLRLSSVVWSGQRESLSQAVGGARRSRRLVGNHPLVRDGQKLLPSITKVFRRDQNLYVLFEVYNPVAEPQRASLTASLSFFRGNAKAFESDALRVNPASQGGSRTVPMQFQVPLAKLAPGSYICQVNVVDELGKKFAFRRTPLVVLP